MSQEIRAPELPFPSIRRLYRKVKTIINRFIKYLSVQFAFTGYFNWAGCFHRPPYAIT
jgi:hypothetical protein